ncbi:MAG: hypothetical protein ACXU61_10265, partial [Croceibacterium sp.]
CKIDRTLHFPLSAKAFLILSQSAATGAVESSSGLIMSDLIVTILVEINSRFREAGPWRAA